MVIFNLWAIPVGIVVAIVGGALTWMFPSLGEGGLSLVIYGLVMLVVGGAAELVDVKGRLFFLPMWLIGLGLSVYGAYELLGVLGLVAGGVLLVAALVGLVFLSRKAGARELAEAPAKLTEAQQAIAGGAVDAFWARMRDAFLPPAFGAITKEHARTMADAVALLEDEATTLGLGEDAHGLLSATQAIARSVAKGASSPGFFSKERGFFGEVETLIAKQGAWDPPEHVLTDLREWQSKGLAA